MRTIRKVIGIILIASFFCGLVGMTIWKIGLIESLIVWGCAIGAVGILLGGIFLMAYED